MTYSTQTKMLIKTIKKSLALTKWSGLKLFARLPDPLPDLSLASAFYTAFLLLFLALLLLNVGTV